jgi:hypothetical protein
MRLRRLNAALSALGISIRAVIGGFSVPVLVSDKQFYHSFAIMEKGGIVGHATPIT